MSTLYACPVCTAPDSARLPLTGNGYAIRRCRACGLAFTEIGASEPAPERLYPVFNQSDTVAHRQARSLLDLFLYQREAVVRAAAPAGGRLLDFGCGNGAFAAWMSRRGHEAVGVEPFSVGAAATAPGLTIWRAPLEAVADRLGEFDVITLWHVLEHLGDPVAVLAALRRHLRPGGALIVSVPNLASWQARLFRGAWFHLDPPRHLLHFEAATLRDCLARAGLEPFAERRFLPEYGSSGWVQSALNAVLPRPNHLYEWAKDRGALADVPRGKSLLLLAGSVVLAVPALALSLPLELAAVACGAQAALTLAARTAR